METDMQRRPLASRSSGWAQALARWLAGTAITPNQISALSVLFALAGAAFMLWGAWALLAAAACVQLRLLCNLLDGMVAIEGGKASKVGPLWNEVPDRVADSLLLVAAGYAAAWPWAGWLAALAAVATAYVRAFGASLGLGQDFSGIMSKPRRMAALTAGLLVAMGEGAVAATIWSLRVAVLAIALGSLLTCATRLAGIARGLRNA